MAPLLAPFVKQRLKFLFILVKAMVEKFAEETTILCDIADGSPLSSPCYLWYSNKISTSVKSITIQKKTTNNQYKSTISF